MKSFSRYTLVLIIAWAGAAITAAPQAQADTPITDFECLTDESDNILACYRFYRLDESDGPDFQQWETSRVLATGKTCDLGEPCQGQTGFLATILSEEENEFLRDMAIRAQSFMNDPYPPFPADNETVKQCWVGGARSLAWNKVGDNKGVWGEWVTNGFGSIYDTNDGPGFADWGPGEPNNVRNVEYHLGWNRRGLSRELEVGLFNDEGAGLNQMYCYIAQFGPWQPGDDVQIFSSPDGTGPRGSANLEVALTAASFQCDVKIPRTHRPKDIRIDKLLKKAAKHDAACAALVEQLPAHARTILPWYFEPRNEDRRVTFTLAKIENPDGGSSSDGIGGPVTMEYPTSSNIDLGGCSRVEDEGTANERLVAVDSSRSTVTVGANLDNRNWLARRLFFEDDYCNRPRSKQKFSTVLSGIPFVAVARNPLVYLPAADIRVLATIRSLLRKGEVDRHFLLDLRHRYLAASHLAQNGHVAGVHALEDVLRFVFLHDGYDDPYENASGGPLADLAADIAPVPKIAWQLRLFHDDGDPLYVQPLDLRCELMATLDGDFDEGGVCQAFGE